MGKLMGPSDLSRFSLVSSPQLNPQGSRALFIVSKPDLDKDTYLSRIRFVDLRTKSVEALTEGPSDTCPKWRPDGEAFSFLSRRGLKEEEPGQGLWMWRPCKGEPYMIKLFKGGISQYEWCPDSRHIAVVAPLGKPEEDVKEIDKIPIWFNGKGFIYWGWNSLLLLDSLSGEIKELTPKDLEIRAASCSPKGKEIAYISIPDRLKPFLNEVHIVNTETGEDRKVTEGLTAYDISWSPNGKYLAILGHRRPRGLLSHERILVIDLGSNEETDLTGELDRSVGNSMNSDVRGPSCSKSFKWVGNNVYFLLNDEGRVKLFKTDLKGYFTEIVSLKKGVVDEFDVANHEELIYTAMTPTSPKELYAMINGEIIKLTSFNDEVVKEFDLTEPSHFSFKASDGARIDGWILPPPKQVVGVSEAKERGKGLPWILYVHGGPKTQFGWSFIHEFHVLAAEGFTIIFSNPRGSDGYSEEFSDIRGHYGERDYQDLMEFVDEVLKKHPNLDPKKGGVTGGSYGGFMTNWIITHTDRFKAAVTQRSISDWVSMYGTTDIGYYFVKDQIGCVPWENIQDCLRQSPLMYVKNAKTPTLIIHSMEDYRCWMDQAIELFTALRESGVKAKLALFPKENHNLSRSGKPKHRVKRLELMVSWMKENILGKQE